jgi:1-acyl-sn-glycerol-3-phosphate acyltransferase
VSVFYWVVKAILGPFLALLFRPWAEGTENVPREGPAILASNHLSFSDHFFGPLPLPRKVTFLAKAEYFTGRGLKGLVSKAFFRGVGQIPVDRAGGQASDRALATGLRVLAEGRLLGIYPEGTRTPDGRLYRGKTGVARLALESGAPVIPTAMVGTFDFMPSGRHWPRLRIRPGVRFGKPLDFSRYSGLQSDHLVLRAVTDEIMYALMELSGQEYVDEYAQQAKSRARARADRKRPSVTAAPGAVAAAAPVPGATLTAAPGSGAEPDSGAGVTPGPDGGATPAPAAPVGTGPGAESTSEKRTTG